MTFQKFVPATTGATHKLEDASFSDFINPSVALSAEADLLRLGIVALLVKAIS